MKTDIVKYDFRPGLPQEFEIVDLAELYASAKDALTTTHRAGFYHVIWFREGSPTHLVDFKPIKIQDNTLLFLSKDTVQRFDHETPFKGLAILFTDSFFGKSEIDNKFLRNSILFNDLFSVSKIQLKEQTKTFADLLQQMTIELQNVSDSFQADILQNLLHSFLLLCEREKQKQNFKEVKKGPDFDYVLLFRDILEASYKNEKRVSYYAKKIIITEKRLNHATSKVLGKTSKEIINDRVVLEAKRVLAHTNGSIKEIAYDLGFEEPSNFIKYFKKHSKFTPTEFREKNTLA